VTSVAGQPPSRPVLLAALIGGYLLAMYLCFRPVQLRIWNDLGAVDVLTMAGLILPFLVMPWLARPRLRVTRYAWGASAVMALAKPVLIPVVVGLLAVACVKGEQMVIVAAGFLCAVGETLYGTYPTAWWSTA
jgi:hypothetical protein